MSSNTDVLKSLSTNDTFSNLVYNGRYGYDFNQRKITSEEFTNYIVQTIMTGFCSMIDYTGKIFNSMMSYIRVKNYVYDELTKSQAMCDIKSDIAMFMDRVMSDGCPDDNYKTLVNLNKDIDFNDKDLLVRIHDHYMLYGFQLKQLIFSKICRGCDKALSDVLLGIKISPNKGYLIENGCKYYNIKHNGPDVNYQIYYYLNAELTNMNNRLMEAVVAPAIDKIFDTYLFNSLYFIYYGGTPMDKDRIDEDNALEDFGPIEY